MEAPQRVAPLSNQEKKKKKKRPAPEDHQPTILKPRKKKRALSSAFNPTELVNNIAATQHATAPTRDTGRVEVTEELAEATSFQVPTGFVSVQLDTKKSEEVAQTSQKQVWLIQMPLDWDMKSSAQLQLHKGTTSDLLGECCDQQGTSYAIEAEHSEFTPLYAALVRAGKDQFVQVSRRVTLVKQSQQTLQSMLLESDVQGAVAVPKKKLKDKQTSTQHKGN